MKMIIKNMNYKVNEIINKKVAIAHFDCTCCRFFSADESISMMGLSQEASNLGGIITTILSGTFSKLS